MMLDHLRHTFFLLSAGLIFFSCSTDEPATSRHEMKFDISAVSRSAVTTAGNITRSPFALFGDRIPTAFAGIPSAEKSIIYFNTPVSFSNSAWTTPEPQFWYDKHEHSFVAIHPASVISASDANIQYLNNQLSFSYTLPSDHTQISDIMVATHRRRYIDQREYDKNNSIVDGTGADPVYLNFGHIMSQINVAPAFEDNTKTADNDFIEIHKLEISGFNDRAKFNIVPASLQTTGQTDDRTVAVSGQEGNGSITVDFTSPKRVANHGGNVNLFDSNNTLIMLPQTFNDISETKIVLSYTLNDENSMRQLTLPLKSQKWESGKSYSYKFVIDRKGLQSENSTITDWTQMNVVDVNVN